MINLLRVDDKLLHGQVAFSWVRNLKIHTIVIADDRIAYDEFSKMTLGLSKPVGVNLKILEVKDAIVFLKEQLHSELHVMAIVNSLQNVDRILENIPDINSVNLGSLRERYGSQTYSKDIALTKEDIQICRKIMAQGHELEMRMTYSDVRLDIKDLLDKINKQ